MTRSTSSSSMPSTASEAMARAQLLLRFPPAAEQMDEWCATIQSLLGFAEAKGHDVPPRHDLPKQLQHPLPLPARGEPSPWCNPHHGS